MLREPTYRITTPYCIIPYTTSTSQQLPQVSSHSPVFTAASRKTGIREHWIPAAVQLCRFAVAATIKVCFILLYLHTFNQVCVPWHEAQKVRDGWDEKGKYGQERSHTLPFSKLNLHPLPFWFWPQQAEYVKLIWTAATPQHHHIWGCSLSKTSYSVRYFQPNSGPIWYIFNIFWATIWKLWSMRLWKTAEGDDEGWHKANHD